ncbi:hypothetical protein DRF60_06195 [Chryseobacterium elymi]|uniref:Uncharacterized protein n=1 Tax=Chryseobacterium elymi TaxID=395936 RepID=A0A3D9DN21_9FLAO|nr:hypothetical protein [Chryseobacterium elymi]REC79414.1 hypothetical protein DRF60_06195 [Chryseobacterium elymi]
MEINDIKDHIAEKFSSDYRIWSDVLNNTQPENYVCKNWQVEISQEDIFVDTPSKTFSVNEGFFACNLTLQSDNQGDDITYSKSFSAKGTFQLNNINHIEIEDVDIAIEIDIF